jgi:hypothetical protein
MRLLLRSSSATGPAAHSSSILKRGLDTGSDNGPSGGLGYLLDNGIAGEAIHAESGMCVHAGGQLPFGGRFGSGAAAAKPVGAGGGLPREAEDGAVDEVGVATGPRARE